MVTQDDQLVTDLILLEPQGSQDIQWSSGSVLRFVSSGTDRISEFNGFLLRSQADYLCIWSGRVPLPDPQQLTALEKQGLDLAHCGLSLGAGAWFPDLCYLGTSWDKLNAPAGIPSPSWRMTFDACMIRTRLLVEGGGLDPAFESLTGAALEFGYRCYRLGGLVEHRPELMTTAGIAIRPEAPTLHDLYLFILRHYGFDWAKYVLLRRTLHSLNWRRERRAWHQAMASYTAHPPAWSMQNPVWYQGECRGREVLSGARVSVIIPTLGRYDYLEGALESLRTQSLKPAEVIIVDQNDPDQRRPDLYLRYQDLNIQVSWQEERGQSLARNTALSQVNQEYVFFFDDDSIAFPDLIENHLKFVLAGSYDASTGISMPPPPTDYQLPVDFRFPQFAHTFDTGNCLLPARLARQVGGFDRNYDFGPGTDADFGTRLYLSGHRILHNPYARRYHYKAASGGLRAHGAHKRNTDAGLLSPFPPVTQCYYLKRYMNPRQTREAVWIAYLTSKVDRNLRRDGLSILKRIRLLSLLIIRVVLLPLKYTISSKKASQMLAHGARLPLLDPRSDKE